tara:strand:- start:812 stop:1420 length:609 start_codon:yes stop_codon:yes gene_type:complete
MFASHILAEFDAHATRLREAHRARKAAVAMKSVVEDREEREAVAVVDTLGRRQPADVYEGDVNIRTLRTLLSMVDERGWERCARALFRFKKYILNIHHSDHRSPHQMQFHASFEKCVARVLYREEWSTLKPAIMKHNKWTRCSSEVMIRSYAFPGPLHTRPKLTVVCFAQSLLQVLLAASGRLSGSLRPLLLPVTCRRLVSS